MANEVIRGYDIPGSSYTAFVHHDYKQERAVRRFLVYSDSADKTSVLEWTVVALKFPAASNSLSVHNQNFSVAAVEDPASPALPGSLNSTTHSFLPLQTASIRKAGYQLWLVELVYFYL